MRTEKSHGRGRREMNKRKCGSEITDLTVAKYRGQANQYSIKKIVSFEILVLDMMLFKKCVIQVVRAA